VWKEFSRALEERSPQAFLTSLHLCGALRVITPELEQLYQSPSNPLMLKALEHMCALSPSGKLRFAALFTGRDSEAATALCLRLGVPNEFRELALLSTGFYPIFCTAPTLNAEQLFALYRDTDALRRPQRFEDFLLVCQAQCEAQTNPPDVHPEKTAHMLSAGLKSISTIDTQALINQGFKGKKLGEAINRQRLDILSEKLRPQNNE
jgi:tRNA nucleotidyltransferase (CCA-adding enzyme)